MSAHSVMTLNTAFKAFFDPRFEEVNTKLNAILDKLDHMVPVLAALEKEMGLGTTQPLIDDEAKEASESEEEESELDVPDKRPRVESESSEEDPPAYTKVKRVFLRDDKVWMELVNDQGDSMDVPAETVKKNHADLYKKFVSIGNVGCIVEYVKWVELKNRGRVVSTRPRFSPINVEDGRRCKFHDAMHPDVDFDDPSDDSCRVQIKEGTF